MSISFNIIGLLYGKLEIIDTNRFSAKRFYLIQTITITHFIDCLRLTYYPTGTVAMVRPGLWNVLTQPFWSCRPS